MTKIHAKIHIHGKTWNACWEPTEYSWTVVVLGVECSKCEAFYKTGEGAERAAIRWCKRLGFAYTVTVDKDIRS